jgi:hypothetical protein
MKKGYQLAYQLACEELGNIDDIEQLCLRSGASYKVIDSKKTIALEYLSRSYQVALPDIEISLEDSEEEVPLVDQILILHYLLQAKGTPLSNEMIGYKHLPGGSVYFPTFSKRAIKPIVDSFGKEPARLLDVAAAIGGREAAHGDVAVTIDAFRRVPITFVLWRGDEEFAADGNILFDSTVSDYLTTDDINAVCGIIAWKLVRGLQAAGPEK